MRPSRFSWHLDEARLEVIEAIVDGLFNIGLVFMLFDEPFELPVDVVVLVQALLAGLVRIVLPLGEDWGRLVKGLYNLLLFTDDVFGRNIFLSEVADKRVNLQRLIRFTRLYHEYVTTTLWEGWGHIDILMVLAIAYAIAVNEEWLFVWHNFLKVCLPGLV